MIPPRALSSDRQAQRLAPSIDILQQSLSLGANSDPAFASPDRALVFEVIGPIEKFVQAAEQIGFEWLTEDYSNNGPERTSGDEDSDTDDIDTAMSRMYLTMPTIDGMQRLLAMWNRFIDGKQPEKSEKDWWKIFGYLSEIRPWNAIDRITPTTQAFIDRQLGENPHSPVRLEVDLWFRGVSELRDGAHEALKGILSAVGGRIVDYATIEQIRYQVALVEVPPEEAGHVRSRSGTVAQADQIMSIRPQSLFRSTPESEGGEAADPITTDDVAQLGPAVAAILDGYPIANHQLLAGRVEVEEVDITGTMAPVDRRYHGTAIASLIIHGDLAAGEAPISRKLKVVPVLAAPQDLSDERTPSDFLSIGLIYRAVQALKAGADGNPPRGPNVVIINHSICDTEGAFIQRPSAWARLLDWMSLEYGVLFVVSAGNITEQFSSGYANQIEYAAASMASRQITTLRAVEATKGMRGLLSPAEAMNALTVGALHLDAAGACPSAILDPFSPVGVPNLGSAIGPGINRALKPDMVEAGGRQIARTLDTTGGHVLWPAEDVHLGQKAAAPDQFGGSSSHTLRSTGTSNAAALVTRAGIKIIDALEHVLVEEGSTLSQFSHAALATKALLVHGSAWRDAGVLLNETYPPSGAKKWRARRSSITKFLGFGRSDFDRVISGDKNRITLLGDDEISHDQLHEYRIPIPVSMVKSRELRRVTITLAWTPPFHPTSIAYRGAALDIVDKDGKRDFWKGVKKVVQPHPDDMRRGTVVHFILEGTNSTNFSDKNGLFIGIQARALHPSFEQLKVPYALAITLEVAATVREDIYASVVNAIRPRERVQT
jgi:hypothetical protein